MMHMNQGQTEFMATDRIAEFHREAAARELVHQAKSTRRLRLKQRLHHFVQYIATIRAVHPPESPQDAVERHSASQLGQ